MSDAGVDNNGMSKPGPVRLRSGLQVDDRPIAAVIDQGCNPMRRMYARTLSLWAHDLLAAQPKRDWQPDDPAADFRNRDWRALYAGDVLDD